MTLIISFGLSHSLALTIQHPSLRALLDPCHQFLQWKEVPKHILLIKKISDSQVTKDSKELTRWLIKVWLLFIMTKLFVLALS